jgi:aminoglycoside 3-N-acetyltransferase I
MARRTKKMDAPAADQDGADQSLRRERAGLYRTRDGRFSVEQDSGRWLVSDEEQTDELGLPRIRGPFATLDEVRDAIRDARAEPAQASPLEERMRAARSRPKADANPAAEGRTRSGRAAPRTPDRARSTFEKRAGPRAAMAETEPVPIDVRRLGANDADLLARLSRDSGQFEAGAEPLVADHRPLDDGDARAFLKAQDTHVLVALEGDEPVGFLLAYELLRRHGQAKMLLIYELGVREARRREGVGRRLFEELAELARERGIRRAFALTNTWNGVAVSFYRSLGGIRSADDQALFTFELGR